MGNKIRIGHITDLHARHHQPGTSKIEKRRSREVLGMLPEALKMLREKAVDFLAITGDLLDVPDEVIEGVAKPQAADGSSIDSLLAACGLAIEDYQLIKSILDDGGIPYTVLPGNHDLESAMWQVLPQQPHEFEVNGYRIIRFCDREHEGHVPRRVGADRERWQKLINCLDDRRQIHLQHYVITPELNLGYPHTYADGEQIRQANSDCGRCVLCVSGHYHNGTDLLTCGKCSFVTGTAFCEAPHRFRIYEIGPAGVVVEEMTRQNGQWSSTNGQSMTKTP